MYAVNTFSISIAQHELWDNCVPYQLLHWNSLSFTDVSLSAYHIITVLNSYMLHFFSC